MKEENISEILGIDENSKANSTECSTKEEGSSSAFGIENGSKVDTNICDSEKKQGNHSDEVHNISQPFTSIYECNSQDLQSDSTETLLIFMGGLTASLCMIAGIIYFILSIIERKYIEGVIMCIMLFLPAIITYSVLKVLAHISMTLKEINSKVG